MSSSHSQTSPEEGSKNKLLPVLIIPGFMSSGLEVQKSTSRPEWVGERIWINLTSLGIQSLHFGKSVSERNNDNDDSDEEDDETDEVKRNISYKSEWLHHMVLANDMLTEPDGVEVRNIQGLAGVDYLMPGMLTNHASYVFGPVIKALQEAGYVEGKNLDAAPYDWRLPPVELERRDQYFTRTIQQVQGLYDKNDQTPVVLMCHSLGCKTGHYFLNFCLKHKGREWIDQHIHTYMPVGAPHLGAPKALRSVVSGDKMGLEAFLSDSEALTFGRSLGSGLWLFPKELPEGAPPCLQCQPRGLLEITMIGNVDVLPMIKSRRIMSRSSKFKLSLVFNDVVVTTEYHREEDDKVEFQETFLFATDASGPTQNGNDDFQVILLEPGTKASKSERPDRSCCCHCVICFLQTVTCIWICSLFCCLVKQSFILSAEAVSRAFGGSTIIAASDPIHISNVVDAKNKTMAAWEVDLLYGRDLEGKGSSCCRRKRHPVTVRFRVEWKEHIEEPATSCSEIAVKHSKTEGPALKRKYAENAEDLMKKEGLDDILQGMKTLYDTDPLGPRGMSSVDAPPVSRVYAIYGINLPTEVGSVYARRSGMIQSNVSNFFDLDKHAKLSGDRNGYKLKGGLLLETRKTEQTSATKEQVICSGDGTVPYYSLNHCRTWESQCNVQVKEIDKAEHREILADERFHEAVINYVRQ